MSIGSTYSNDSGISTRGLTAFHRPSPFDQRTGSLEGTHTGIVMDDHDPQRNGRVWVYIPGVSAPVFNPNIIPTEGTARDRQQDGQLMDNDYRHGWMRVQVAQATGTGNDAHTTQQGPDQRNAIMGDFTSWGTAGAPRIGDRVTVQFASGDASTGIVTGAVPRPNSQRMVPEGQGTPRSQLDRSQVDSPDVARGTDQDCLPPNDRARTRNDRQGRRRTVDTARAGRIVSSGTAQDVDRGAGTSSGARESPSYVRGFRSPGWNQSRERNNRDGRGRRWRTRGGNTQRFHSSGHSLSMDDSPDHSNVRIRSGGNSQILMRDEGQNSYIYMQSNRGRTLFEMNDQGRMRIYNKKGLALHSDDSVDISSKKDVNISSQQGRINILAQNDLNITVHGDYRAAYNKTANSAYKGIRQEYMVDSYLVTAGQSMHLKVGKELIISGKNLISLRSESGPIRVDAKGKLSLKSAAEVAIDGSAVHIQSGMAEAGSLPQEADPPQFPRLQQRPSTPTQQQQQQSRPGSRRRQLTTPNGRPTAQPDPRRSSPSTTGTDGGVSPSPQSPSEGGEAPTPESNGYSGGTRANPLPGALNDRAAAGQITPTFPPSRFEGAITPANPIPLQPSVGHGTPNPFDVIDPPSRGPSEWNPDYIRNPQRFMNPNATQMVGETEDDNTVVPPDETDEVDPTFFTGTEDRVGFDPFAYEFEGWSKYRTQQIENDITRANLQWMGPRYDDGDTNNYPSPIVGPVGGWEVPQFFSGVAGPVVAAPSVPTPPVTPEAIIIPMREGKKEVLSPFDSPQDRQVSKMPKNSPQSFVIQTDTALPNILQALDVTPRTDNPFKRYVAPDDIEPSSEVLLPEEFETMMKLYQHQKMHAYWVPLPYQTTDRNEPARYVFGGYIDHQEMRYFTDHAIEDDVIEFITSFTNLLETPEFDVLERLIVGYGHLIQVGDYLGGVEVTPDLLKLMQNPLTNYADMISISEEEAEALLRKKLQSIKERMQPFLTKALMTRNMFVSLMSLVTNVTVDVMLQTTEGQRIFWALDNGHYEMLIDAWMSFHNPYGGVAMTGVQNGTSGGDPPAPVAPRPDFEVAAMLGFSVMNLEVGQTQLDGAFNSVQQSGRIPNPTELTGPVTTSSGLPVIDVTNPTYIGEGGGGGGEGIGGAGGAGQLTPGAPISEQSGIGSATAAGASSGVGSRASASAQVNGDQDTFAPGSEQQRRRENCYGHDRSRELAARRSEEVRQAMTPPAGMTDSPNGVGQGAQQVPPGTTAGAQQQIGNMTITRRENGRYDVQIGNQSFRNVDPVIVDNMNRAYDDYVRYMNETYGRNPITSREDMFRTAAIESQMGEQQRNSLGSSCEGVFQICDREWQSVATDGGYTNKFDPYQNTSAYMDLQEARYAQMQSFYQERGRLPTGTEMFIAHNVGQGTLMQATRLYEQDPTVLVGEIPVYMQNPVLYQNNPFFYPQGAQTPWSTVFDRYQAKFLTRNLTIP